MKKDLDAQTLLFPTPTLVVGTYDAEGKPNAMTAAWGGICCSRPPCVTISLRKATYTYNSLMEGKVFTLNVPGKEHMAEMDYFGIASGRDRDKFAEAKLTPVKGQFVNAPYIEEFPLNLECKIVHIVDLGLHTQFVGEVLGIKVDEALVADDTPMIEQIMPIIYAPDSRNYYAVGEEIGKAYSVGKTVGVWPEK